MGRLWVALVLPGSLGRWPWLSPFLCLILLQLPQACFHEVAGGNSNRAQSQEPLSSLHAPYWLICIPQKQAPSKAQRGKAPHSEMAKEEGTRRVKNWGPNSSQSAVPTLCAVSLLYLFASEEWEMWGSLRTSQAGIYLVQVFSIHGALSRSLF